jgi:hemoglobin-like flavoprotein
VLLRLGQRHGDYGVTAAHYDSVGAALLDTLAAGLGDRFTAETRDAWIGMYRLVASTMQEGANAAVLAA